MAKATLTEEQKDFIKEMAPVLNDDKLTEELNGRFNATLKRSTVSYTRRKLGINKVRGRGVCRVRAENAGVEGN